MSKSKQRKPGGGLSVQQTEEDNTSEEARKAGQARIELLKQKIKRLQSKVVDTFARERSRYRYLHE
jgi:hypothetical protein